MQYSNHENIQAIISKIREEKELDILLTDLTINLPSGSEFINKEHSFVHDKERQEIRVIYRFYVNGRYCSVEIDYCTQTTNESSRVYYNYNTPYYNLGEFFLSF